MPSRAASGCGGSVRTRPSLLGAGLLAAAAILAAASGCGSGPAQTTTRTPVTVTEFAFTPAEITVTVGQRAAVQLQNRGTTLHDWTIDAIPAQDIAASGAQHSSQAGHGIAPVGTGPLHVAADQGKTAEVSFTPTRAGEYAFYCSVPGHREAGMQGKLTVR